MNLFDNPVGCPTSLAKSPVLRRFSAEVVQKLKFPDNSNRPIQLFNVSSTEGLPRDAPIEFTLFIYLEPVAKVMRV
jgi:hypothetical protein